MEKLEFDVIGDGPALMLVPGTNSTALETWGASVQALSRTHTLILPDLPGTASRPDGPIDPVRLAGRLVEAASRAGHERFDIAGASLGAPISLITAALHPASVTRVISVCGYSRARQSLLTRLLLWERLLDHDPELSGMLLLVLGMTDATFALTPAETVQAMSVGMGNNRRPGLREQLALARSIDADALLPGITAPVLVVSGSGDAFVDPAHSRTIAETVPHGIALEFDAGHGLAHEKAAELARVITAFTSGGRVPSPA